MSHGNDDIALFVARSTERYASRISSPIPIITCSLGEVVMIMNGCYLVIPGGAFAYVTLAAAFFFMAIYDLWGKRWLWGPCT